MNRLLSAALLFACALPASASTRSLGRRVYLPVLGGSALPHAAQHGGLPSAVLPAAVPQAMAAAPVAAAAVSPARATTSIAIPRQPSFDYDVAVIGSGYGGSVAALRFAEAQLRVIVL